MSKIKHLIVTLLLLISFSVSSQTRNWTTKTSKDGETTVKYDLEKEDGGTHLYYVAERNSSTSLDELDAYFSKSDNHKFFLENTTKSDEVKKTSDNEWITYYYFDAPWPMPNSDVVVKFNKSKTDDTLIFTANVITGEYGKKDVDRLTTYKFIYTFKKVDDNTTKISITADFISVGSVPNFLVRSWFPEGPARIISNLGSLKTEED